MCVSAMPMEKNEIALKEKKTIRLIECTSQEWIEIAKNPLKPREHRDSGRRYHFLYDPIQNDLYIYSEGHPDNKNAVEAIAWRLNVSTGIVCFYPAGDIKTIQYTPEEVKNQCMMLGIIIEQNKITGKSPCKDFKIVEQPPYMFDNRKKGSHYDKYILQTTEILSKLDTDSDASDA
jgi:hypothetical protein